MARLRKLSAAVAALARSEMATMEAQRAMASTSPDRRSPLARRLMREERRRKGLRRTVRRLIAASIEIGGELWR